MPGSPQWIRCAASVLAITALLVLPAAVSTAQPIDVVDSPGTVSGFWSAVWAHLTDLADGWWGEPLPDEPDEPMRAFGDSEAGNLGPSLDPDGLHAQDPVYPESSDGDHGSKLQVDG